MANGLNIVAPTGETSSPPPPPNPIEDGREMVFPSVPFRFYPLDLGLALGITAVIFMLLSTLVALKSNPAGMGIFVDLFPGFDLQSLGGVLLGLVWSFVSGFVLGGLTGFFYNWRLRRYVTG